VKQLCTNQQTIVNRKYQVDKELFSSSCKSHRLIGSAFPVPLQCQQTLLQVSVIGLP
jgi:hypothetical protein